MAKRVSEMNHSQISQATLNFVLKCLISEHGSKRDISVKDVLEEMYKFIDIEAADRDDPLIKFFAHTICSYYQVITNADNGFVSMVELVRQRTIIQQQGKISKPTIVMPDEKKERIKVEKLH